MSTLEDIRKIGKEVLDIPPEKVVPEATIESLGLDSLDLVELVCAAEDELGVSIEDDKAMGFKTVADIIKLIDDNRENK